MRDCSHGTTRFNDLTVGLADADARLLQNDIDQRLTALGETYAD